MVIVKVLGPGCRNCERVQMHAEQAVEELKGKFPDADVSIEKVTETMKFMDYGLLNTPGLVVDGKLVSSGKIPSPAQILGWLEEALAD